MIKNYNLKLLASPGIRKSPNIEIVEDNQILAEDTAGTMSYKNFALFWVGDGAPSTIIKFEKEKYINDIKESIETSRLGPIRLFGSRAIAKSCGYAFEKTVIDMIQSGKINFAQSFKELKKNKKNTFIELFKNNLYSIIEPYFNYIHFKTYIQKSIKNNSLEKIFIGKESDKEIFEYKLTWSVSFLGTILNSKTGELNSISLGDCLGICFSELDDDNINNELLNNASNQANRIFVEWNSKNKFANTEYELKIVMENPYVKRVLKLDSMSIMSDGVIDEKKLKSITSIEYLHSNFRSITDDDKIIMILSKKYSYPVISAENFSIDTINEKITNIFSDENYFTKRIMDLIKNSNNKIDNLDEYQTELILMNLYSNSSSLLKTSIKLDMVEGIGNANFAKLNNLILNLESNFKKSINRVEKNNALLLNHVNKELTKEFKNSFDESIKKYEQKFSEQKILIKGLSSEIKKLTKLINLSINDFEMFKKDKSYKNKILKQLRKKFDKEFIYMEYFEFHSNYILLEAPYEEKEYKINEEKFSSKNLLYENIINWKSYNKLENFENFKFITFLIKQHIEFDNQIDNIEYKIMIVISKVDWENLSDEIKLKLGDEYLDEK